MTGRPADQSGATRISELRTARGDGRKNQPTLSLHQRILSDLRGKILSADWPPGHRVPAEHELMAQYECSRMTVNKVVGQLVDAGLVERRRRAGSFVIRPRSQSAILVIQDIKAEVQDRGEPYRFEVTNRRKRRWVRADVPRLDLDPSAFVLDVSCRHFAGAQVFCVEERIINLVAVPDAALETFAVEAPGPWLVRHVPWTEAEHRIRALPAAAPDATALEAPSGTACLVVERRTWRSDQPVTFVRLIYPGAAHELVARFKPSG